MPAIPLPLALPTRVQLQAENGTCGEAVDSVSGVGTNDAVEFSGVSD